MGGASPLPVYSLVQPGRTGSPGTSSPMLSLRFLASDHYDAGFPEGVLDSYYVKGNETYKQLWFNSRSNHNSLFKSPR